MMQGTGRASWSSTIESIVDQMTTREKVGQLVMALNAPGWSNGSDIDMLIRQYHIGSVISFGYHSLDPAQAARYNNALQQTAADTRLAIPLLNSGDFEQGLVSRMRKGVTDFPHQMGLGATRDAQGAERAAELAGLEERALGFHWTFAPLADVNVNPANPVVGIRSFGSDTHMVAEMVARQIRGYRRAGVMATVKHFPGHGDTSVDSHQGLPTISQDWETLASVHLPPFLAAIREGVDAIMTAHIVVPAVDPELPATLSPRILTGLLREELGFDGIIVTDAMSMRAVAARWGMVEGAVMAVEAGADVVIVDAGTEIQIQTYEALLRAVEAGTIQEKRLDESVRRILAAKERCGLLENPYVDAEHAGAVAGSPDHLALATDLASRSITLVKNDGLLPFDAGSPEVTLVAGVTNHSQFGESDVSHVSTVAGMVRGASAGEVIPWSAATENPTDEEIAGAVRLVERADRMIVLTYGRGVVPVGQSRLVGALLGTGKPVVAVATGAPYDIAQYPEVKGYIATYALDFVPTYLNSPRILDAAIRVVFGAESGGQLPVSIPGLYPYGHGVGYRPR